MAFLDFLKSSKKDSVSDSGSQQKEPTWDAETLTVRQPVSPEAPSAGNNQVEESQRVMSLFLHLPTLTDSYPVHS